MWVRYEKSSFVTRCLLSGKPKKFPHLTDVQGEKFYGKLNDFKTTLSNNNNFKRTGSRIISGRNIILFEH